MLEDQARPDHIEKSTPKPERTEAPREISVEQAAEAVLVKAAETRQEIAASGPSESTVAKLESAGGGRVPDDVRQEAASIDTGIQAAKSEAVSEIESAAAERGQGRREFEYRDTEGNLLGRAEVEFDEEEVGVGEQTLDGKGGRGHQVRKLVLHGSLNGQPTQVDVLALTAPGQVKVLMATEQLANYHYSHDKQEAIIPPLETPTNFLTAFHELGHAAQYREADYAPIGKLAGKSRGRVKNDGPVNYYQIKTDLAEVRSAIPEVARAISDEDIRRLEAGQSRIDADRAEVSKLGEQLDHAFGRVATVKNEALASVIGIDAFIAEQQKAETEASQLAPNDPHVSESVARLTSELERMGVVFGPDDPNQPATPEVQPASQPKGSQTVKFGIGKKPAWMAAVESKPTPLTKKGLDLSSIGYLAALVKERLGGSKLETSENSRAIVNEYVFRTGGKKLEVQYRLDVTAGQHEALVDTFVQGAQAPLELEKRFTEAESRVQQAEAREQEIISKMNLQDIADLPVKLEERDATLRAFKWARTVREKAGIDLLAKHAKAVGKIQTSGELAETSCAGSVQRGLEIEQGGVQETSDGRTRLVRALDTYSAKNIRLHHYDQPDDIGVSPGIGKK